MTRGFEEKHTPYGEAGMAPDSRLARADFIHSETQFIGNHEATVAQINLSLSRHYFNGSGAAKLLPGDVYDREVGLLLSLGRAYERLGRKMIKAAEARDRMLTDQRQHRQRSRYVMALAKELGITPAEASEKINTTVSAKPFSEVIRRIGEMLNRSKVPPPLHTEFFSPRPPLFDDLQVTQLVGMDSPCPEGPHIHSDVVSDLEAAVAKVTSDHQGEAAADVPPSS